MDAGSLIGWREKEELDGLCKVKSIGIVFGEDKDSITLTTSVNEHNQATDPISIPKKWINNQKQIGTLEF